MIEAVRNNPAGRDILSHPRKSEIDNAIRAHGVKCHVRKGTLCPCVKFDTGQPQANCAICYGVGYYFTDPIRNINACSEDGITHQIAMGQRSYQRNRQQSGGHTQSGSHIALIYTYTPSDGDLIKPLKDVEVINDEPHIKGKVYLNGQSAERLYHEDIIEVEAIYEADATLSSIIKYEQGINFNLNVNVIEWVIGQPQPNDKKLYTVRYKAHPSYIIIKVEPTLITEHDEDMPKHVREKIDVIMPYQVYLDRLDRTILNNQRNIGI